MAHGPGKIRAYGSPLIIRPDFIGALVLAPRLFRQVAGLHRASPSATLDKSFNFLEQVYDTLLLTKVKQ